MMKHLLCLALVGAFGLAGLVGCEASAKVGDDADHATVKTTVKKEEPSNTVYEQKTVTRTDVQ